MASVVSMKALLESGVHFGHRTNKWNPKMRPFIFTERNGIHIIDLQQTAKSLNFAYNTIRDAAAQGGVVMFVGTKRQAQETVRDEAIRCGMPYVTERWLGGMLTNWVTMYQRINELERLERMRDTGEINRLTKKEGLLIQREINRLLIRLSGVRNMHKVPNMLFVVDVIREETAVHEANLLGVPVVALVDTNCDPGGVDYVIPSNDDAIRAIKLLVGKVADAVLEGKAMRKDLVEEEAEEAIELPVAAGPARGRFEMETEMQDEELLGAATLAKLGTPKREPAPEAPAAPAAAEEAVAETAAVETAAIETASAEAASVEAASVEAAAVEAASVETPEPPQTPTEAPAVEPEEAVEPKAADEA